MVLSWWTTRANNKGGFIMNRHGRIINYNSMTTFGGQVGYFSWYILEPRVPPVFKWRHNLFEILAATPTFTQTKCAKGLKTPCDSDHQVSIVGATLVNMRIWWHETNRPATTGNANLYHILLWKHERLVSPKCESDRYALTHYTYVYEQVCLYL